MAYVMRPPQRQGQGFYDPNMPGPNWGAGFSQMFQQMMQMEQHKKEQQREQEQQRTKQEQWEREFEQEQQRVDAYVTKQTTPVPKTPTVREDRVTYAARMVELEKWNTDEAIRYIATSKEPTQPLALSPKMIKYAVEQRGYTPSQVKGLPEREKITIFNEYDNWVESQKKTTKPPISQPGLIGVARRRAKEVGRRAARQAGVDLTKMPDDAGFEWLLASMGEQSVSPAVQIAQQIDAALAKYEITLSDREMTPQEKGVVQKYVKFLSDIERIFKKDPTASVEKVMAVLQQYIQQ